MAYLTINGVDLDVLIGHERVYDELADEDRAVDGTLVSTRSYIKPKWELDTVVLSRAEADAWASVLLGRGETWKMKDLSGGTNHGYSSKGYAPTFVGTAAHTDFNQAAGFYAGTIYDEKVVFSAGEAARWTLTGQDSLIASDDNPQGDYTLVVWRLEAAVWEHWISRKRTVAGVTGITNWKDGVIQGVEDNAAALAFLFVHASGYLQLGDAATDDDFSDMTALPIAIPTSWAVPIFTYQKTVAAGGKFRPYPKLPRLEAYGDLLSLPVTPRSVKANQVKSALIPTSTAIGDTTGQTTQRLSFNLTVV